MSRRRATTVVTWVLGLTGLGTLAGCSGGEDLTPKALREARARWQRAGIRDYDLEWTTSGDRRGHYLSFVRRGRVREVDSILDDGRRFELHPPDPSYYSVDGLFQTLQEERDQLHSERPFNQPKGTKAVLKFTPDPKLGFPRHYRRDVLGSPRGLAIDVIRLEPDSADPVKPSAGSGGAS